MPENPKKAGFTLIELLIAVAIIGVLAAVAIPQYCKFIGKAKRTEALITLRGAHTGQTSYYASNDHYMNVCNNTVCQMCSSAIYPSTYPAQCHQNFNQSSLGVDASDRTSPQGYIYQWNFPGGDNYQFLMVIGNLVPGISQGQDLLAIGAGNLPSGLVQGCVAAGVGSEGEPIIARDSLTGKQNC